jgi:hypothetical protein
LSTAKVIRLHFQRLAVAPGLHSLPRVARNEAVRNAKTPGYRLSIPGGGAAFAAREDVWNVYLFGMSRIDGCTYWHLSIVGRARTLSVTVKAPRDVWTLAPPDDLLAAVQDWLVSGEPHGYAFDELAPAQTG